MFNEDASPATTVTSILHSKGMENHNNLKFNIMQKEKVGRELLDCHSLIVMWLTVSIAREKPCEVDGQG